MGRGGVSMGPRALAHGLCVVWLCLVAVSAVHEDADSPTPLVDGELVLLGEAKGSATAFYCTPKGESSPQYAYNDKNCASGGTAAKTGLYTCGRSQRVSMKMCTGTAPKCSGPKPGSSKAGGKGGCKDTHDAICQAAKLYGHCKHSSYASQCAKSCGKCSSASRTTVKSVMAQVAAKKAIKKTKKTDTKAAKKAKKKNKKAASKSARKAARKEGKKVAKKKKAKKKLKKAKKKAKKKVKKAKKKIKKAKSAAKHAKKAVSKDKAKLAKAKAKLKKKPSGKKSVLKAKLKVKLAKKGKGCRQEGSARKGEEGL